MTSYAEAFYLLAQAYERTGRKELARQALEKAGTQKRKPFSTDEIGARRLMAGADKRLAEALREDALATDFRRIRTLITLIRNRRLTERSGPL